MADRIEGTAILQTDVTPALLWVVCVADRPDCRPFVESIPVYLAGTPKPCEPGWAYQVEGQTLRVSPSYHLKYKWPEDPPDVWRTQFHNAGQWDVVFVEEQQPAGEGENYFYWRMRELNPSLLTRQPS